MKGLHEISHMSRFLMDTDIYVYTVYYFQYIYLFIYFTFYGTDIHTILLLNELKYSGPKQLYLLNIPNGYNLNCFKSTTIFSKIGVQSSVQNK